MQARACACTHADIGDGYPACTEGDFIELWAAEFKGRVESARAELTSVEAMNDCSPNKPRRMQILISHLDNMKTDSESDQLLQGKTTKTTQALEAKKASVIPDFAPLYLSALYTSLELSYDPKASIQSTCNSRLAKLDQAAGHYSTVRTEEAGEDLQLKDLQSVACSSCLASDTSKKCQSCATAANVSAIAIKLRAQNFCSDMQDPATGKLKGTSEYQRFSIWAFVTEGQAEPNPVCKHFYNHGHGQLQVYGHMCRRVSGD